MSVPFHARLHGFPLGFVLAAALWAVLLMMVGLWTLVRTVAG